MIQWGHAVRKSSYDIPGTCGNIPAMINAKNIYGPGLLLFGLVGGIVALMTIFNAIGLVIYFMKWLRGRE